MLGRNTTLSDVATESVKSQEFAASPSWHFGQVAEDSLTPYWRDRKLVQCFSLLCQDLLKLFRFGFAVVVCKYTLYIHFPLVQQCHHDAPQSTL